MHADKNVKMCDFVHQLDSLLRLRTEWISKVQFNLKTNSGKNVLPNQRAQVSNNHSNLPNNCDQSIDVAIQWLAVTHICQVLESLNCQQKQFPENGK